MKFAPVFQAEIWKLGSRITLLLVCICSTSTPTPILFDF